MLYYMLGIRERWAVTHWQIFYLVRPHLSGKLPVTFPKATGQIPIYYNHTNTGRPATGKEKSLDEIPLNAKQSVLGHSSYYLDLGAQPLFPFGYGLSYTSFEYSDLKTDHTVLTPNDTLSISVKVKNTGQYKANRSSSTLCIGSFRFRHSSSKGTKRV